ncbi:capsular biosynthesis protein [Macrococcoides canis]|uniref:Capsular biosynthesis protein n=1 Tax=Macrococcoides canis TaxID=1855823 RepID=A0AAE7BZK6_9STAP|nr:glycosyltransferase family 4 protein [Macrococcus canis]QIH77981.1 capsular biosynthesis protein [Macrococcus canis]
MKIAILSSVNVKHMSLISLYTSLIDLSKHELDVIYVDKFDIDEDIKNTKIFKYRIDINPNWGKLLKIKKYLNYRKYAKNILTNTDYDLVIVWGTYTAYLFNDILLKKYKGKYIINVRDYFYDDIIPIKFIINKLVKNSIFTVLSSDGFLEFLPASNKYKVVHSKNEQIIINSEIRTNIKDTFPININFIGNIRFYDINQKIIELFKNDERVVLNYIGTGGETLKKFVTENRISNVKFVDGFNIEETSKYLNNTDVLLNAYGNNSKSLDTALSIRLYYALFLKIPIIVSKETYTGKIAKETGLGYELNFMDYDKESFIEWYRNLDYEKISSKISDQIDIIEKQNEEFEEVMKRILS